MKRGINLANFNAPGNQLGPEPVIFDGEVFRAGSDARHRSIGKNKSTSVVFSDSGDSRKATAIDAKGGSQLSNELTNREEVVHGRGESNILRFHGT